MKTKHYLAPLYCGALFFVESSEKLTKSNIRSMIKTEKHTKSEGIFMNKKNGILAGILILLCIVAGLFYFQQKPDYSYR